MSTNRGRLCSYIVTKDTGLAPNPFWGYCTLAVCTLNHMGVRAHKDDWFIGTQSAVRGSKLIYAMQVSETLDFDDYFKDPRFQAKKPVVNGTPCQRCGDNMYYRDDAGQWRKLASVYHRQKIQIDKDLKYPRVFVAEQEHFYYFGVQAIEIPHEYHELIWKRQGCKWHDSNTVLDFLDWLKYNRTPGIHGEPSDMPKRTQVELVSANGVGNCSCSSVQKEKQACAP
jgi:hypothetical protein